MRELGRTGIQVRIPATEVNGSMGEDPNRGGSSRRWIISEAEHSLRRLWTDHIDLYQIQHPEPRNPRMNRVPRHLTDECALDAVERLIPLPEEAGLSLTHLEMAFAISRADEHAAGVTR
ncbi:aldo/keto reductase [Streptomyces scopuliridis]|uniref:aldo/keto reductase n=1 Tax=Streptomyces scopuliridis TaxID=452529 RepID=UPI00368CF9C9